jgi:hypothetical protein
MWLPMGPLAGTLAEFAYRKCYVVQMIFRRTLLAGLLVVAVASCGGDDANDAAAVMDAISEEMENASDSSGDTSEASGDNSEDTSTGEVGDLGFQLTGNKCLDGLQAFNFGLSGINGAILDIDSFNIDTFKANMAFAREAIDDSVKSDFDIVTGAYEKLAEDIAEAQELGGFSTPEGSAALDDLNETFADEKVTNAITNVGQYYSTACLNQ